MLTLLSMWLLDHLVVLVTFWPMQHTAFMTRALTGLDSWFAITLCVWMHVCMYAYLDVLLTLASTQHSHMHACSIPIRDMQNIMSPPLIWCVQAYCWSCKPVSKACKWARHWLHCSAYLAWADSCTGAYGCTCMPVWGLRGCNCIWMLTIGVQQHSGWQDEQSLLWNPHARCFLQD